MALQACPECGLYISTDANACPNCGKSLHSVGEALAGLAMLMVLIVVIGMVVYALRTNGDAPRLALALQQIIATFTGVLTA